MSRRNSPLNFIHVCRYWRSVVLSTKFFWSTLSGNCSSTEAMDYWLAISGPGTKLHLEMSTPSSRCFEGMRKTEMDTARRRAMWLFAVHSGRWASLAFGINAALCQDLAYVLHDVANRDNDNPNNECPLETLEIELKDDDTPQDAVDSLLSAITKFKSLRHLFWISASRNSGMPSVFPWASLSTVCIRASFSFDESVIALMQCTSATEVTLLGTHYSGLRPFTSSTDYPRTLPKLRRLTLNHRPFVLLKYFTLPSLTSLEVDSFRNTDTPQVKEQLSALFDRSQCCLHQFTVQDTYHSMSSDDIIDCLAIPCLRSIPVVRVNAPSWKQRIEKKMFGRSNLISLIPRIIHWDGYLGWHKVRPDNAVSLGEDSNASDEE